MPKGFLNGDYVLGVWADEPVVSPVEDKVKLYQLVQLLDTVFDCCNATVTATPQLLRCWLHSVKPNQYFRKPFQLPGKHATQQKYRRYWKQFICFAFWVWSVGSSLQHEVYRGIQFSKQQQALMSDIWAYLDSPNRDSSSWEGSEIGSEIKDEIDPRMHSESDAESDDESDAEIDDESDAESDDESNAEIDDESDAESDDESDFESDAEIDIESDFESNAGIDIESNAESDSESDFESNAEIDIESDFESSAEIGSESNAEIDDELLAEWLFQLSSLFWVNGTTTGS